MRGLLVSLFLISFLSQAFAADEFNTYRWNRKNYQKKNGSVDNSVWYEWWYYKVVIPETGESFYFVYGIVNPWDKEQKMLGTRSYVGMGDFNSKIVVDTEMDISKFTASYEKTYVKVGDNVGTDKNFMGNLKQDGQDFSWNIDIEHKWTFNPTGWATGKGITDIEWYSAMADASCSGEIFSNGKLHQFKNAPCYQDRNWGHSFPKWWTWIVSNHFEGHPDSALSIGGGKPKVFGKWEPIEGVAIGLKHKGKQYDFRPNDFDKVKMDIKMGKWEAMAYDDKYKVEVSAWAPKESFLDLQFMTPEGDIFHDYETLTGTMTVKLYEMKGFFNPKWVLLDTLHSNYAGIEYGSRDVYDFIDLDHQNINLFSNIK